MTSNDVLRRIRYVFDFNDDTMIAIFGLGDRAVTRAEISDWLKKDDDPAFKTLRDRELATFLDGLIVRGRGKSEGAARPPEERLTNNLILAKLKIALALKSDDMLGLLASAGMRVSRHELAALFRKPDHRHFRVCQDQLLRNFLQGLQLKYRQP